MRDKEREYRHLPYYDKYNTRDRYHQKKEHYYSRKEELLGLLNPSEIHLVERTRRHRIYDNEPEYKASLRKAVYSNCYYTWDDEVVHFCDIIEPFKEYYLYYKVADHTFHSPIDNPGDYNLPIVNIGNLETYGLPTDQLISVQTCEKIYNGLMDGSLSFICDTAE